MKLWKKNTTCIHLSCKKTANHKLCLCFINWCTGTYNLNIIKYKIKRCSKCHLNNTWYPFLPHCSYTENSYIGYPNATVHFSSAFTSSFSAQSTRDCPSGDLTDLSAPCGKNANYQRNVKKIKRLLLGTSTSRTCPTSSDQLAKFIRILCSLFGRKFFHQIYFLKSN